MHACMHVHAYIHTYTPTSSDVRCHACVRKEKLEKCLEKCLKNKISARTSSYVRSHASVQPKTPHIRAPYNTAPLPDSQYLRAYKRVDDLRPSCCSLTLCRCSRGRHGASARSTEPSAFQHSRRARARAHTHTKCSSACVHTPAHVPRPCTRCASPPARGPRAICAALVSVPRARSMCILPPPTTATAAPALPRHTRTRTVAHAPTTRQCMLACVLTVRSALLGWGARTAEARPRYGTPAGAARARSRRARRLLTPSTHAPWHRPPSPAPTAPKPRRPSV